MAVTPCSQLVPGRRSVREDGAQSPAGYFPLFLSRDLQPWGTRTWPLRRGCAMYKTRDRAPAPRRVVLEGVTATLTLDRAGCFSRTPLTPVLCSDSEHLRSDVLMFSWPNRCWTLSCPNFLKLLKSTRSTQGSHT